MPIKISYSPVGEMAQLAFEAGRGKYRQQQQQVQLQMAEMAMRDQAQQRAIQANLLSQGIANQQRNQAAQQEMAFRAAMGQQQFAQQAALQQQQNDAYMQRAEFQRQEMLKQTNLQGQYGMFRGAMDAIYDLEAKGAQYTPEQQRYVSELDAARQKALIDENLDDQGKQLAELQYWQKRSRVTPTQPPPKTTQQMLDEAVATYTFPDGTQVPGVMGERNGVPVFNPIEKPEDQEAKLKAEQEKEAAKLKLEQEKAAAKELQTRKDRVEDAWDTLQQTLTKIELEVPKIDDPKELAAHNERREQTKQKLIESFSQRYWKDAVELAPHIADALGITELEDLIPPKEEPAPRDFQLPSLPQEQAPPLTKETLEARKAEFARRHEAYREAPTPEMKQQLRDEHSRLNQDIAAFNEGKTAAAPTQPETLPPPVQVAKQRGVTPALLEQREAALLAKPPEQWTDEDKAMFEAIQRLKTQLGMDGPATVTVTPSGFRQSQPAGTNSAPRRANPARPAGTY